ncbi:MAG TPA: hypothetical protein VFA74_20555 [Terriglobales bacterium]|nr:hypothetical protein [Terriglobales bacterium]
MIIAPCCMEVESKRKGTNVSGNLRFNPKFIRSACLVNLTVLVGIFMCCPHVSAQNLEVSGGYVHITQNFGLNGFNLGAAWWFSPKVTLAFDYDNAYNNSTLGNFTLTSIGAIVIKNHLQDVLVGPRIFFPQKKIKKYKFDPFAELQFGISHLNTTVQQLTLPSQSASDNAFSWMLGGGADYGLNAHWSARLKLDLLRTHFADQGQSRLRIGLGVAYTFGGR